MTNLPELICKIVGHTYDARGMFSFHCTRCGKELEAIKKIAAAMAAPLKTPLDYQRIGRSLFKIEKIDD